MSVRPSRSVLVFGASSQLGHCLLPMLRAQGVQAIAVSREPHDDRDENARWLLGKLPMRVYGDFDAIDTVVCFAPLDALAEWISNTPLPSLQRVVATSSMSAESKRNSPVEAERAVAQRLREGEQALKRACESRDVAWSIFRPTLVYGVGRDRSLTPLARRAARTRVFVLPPGRGLRQPVHAQDVASAIMGALQTSNADDRIIDIGGGERLRAQEMFARVRDSLPVRTLPLRAPRLAVRAAMALLPFARGPLSRLDADLIADNTDLENLLNVHPRGFAPDARSFDLQP